MYLISSEVKEEIEEILYILKRKKVKKSDILLHIPKNIYLEDINLSSYKVMPYKKSSNFKVLNKIIELVKFTFTVMKYKPDVVFSGFSMFKHRLNTKIFNIKHVAYFRGLMFDSKNISGLMDKMKFGIFGIFFQSKIFNTYEADVILTTSKINKKFIMERGVIEEKIKLIQPLWLNGIVLKETANNRVYFLTQAFKAHGFMVQHNSQINFLKILDEWCAENNKALTLRIHPRDYFDYNSITYKSKVSFDRTAPKKFIQGLSYTDIVISPLSTLAFEIVFLGGCCYFYTTAELNHVYASAYSDLSINPINVTDLHKTKDFCCGNRINEEFFFHGTDEDIKW